MCETDSRDGASGLGERLRSGHMSQVWRGGEGDMTRVINIADLPFYHRTLVLAGQLPGYKYIGRNAQGIGYWGNRYSHSQTRVLGVIRVKSREEAVAKHAEETRADPGKVERIKRELKDLILVCWCKPRACHGDTYVALADGWSI